jgi:ribosome biogenesis GTPase
VVTRVDFGSCLLRAEAGAVEATVRGRLMGPRKSLGNAVVVGDRARYALEQGRAVVTEVEPRRNAFSRRGAGERAEEQVVAANLDQVVVVAAIVQPPFRAGLVDRVLCQAEHAGVPARLVINKCDLAPAAEIRAILDDYARADYAGHALSARTGEGVEALRHACRGRRSLFAGHSGVGKSTLLNALAPGVDLLAGRVNPRTGKGRHTTSAAWLLTPEPGLELIDTPGVRAFGLWGIGPRDLEQSWPEFRRHLGECRFANCRHESEPGCAIRTAAEAGEISARRWESFRKLRAELEREAVRR